MPKLTFRIREGEPLFDIVSYGRGGAREGSRRLMPEQVEQVRRTVQRAPEVVVKVLPRNSNDLKSAAKHLDYITRNRALALEGDSEPAASVGNGMTLLEDWDLDIDGDRRQGKLSAKDGRKAPKLIHKLMFSMPPGTPPEKVAAAVRHLAREQFALQHRYAFVLHIDEPHPHVHLVMKAVSEQGTRLNISRATLRTWRAEFARHLRLLGVAANATERAVRGQGESARKDGIYRASRRGQSTYVREQAEAVSSELLKGNIRAELGKQQLVETRNKVVRGWLQVARGLSEDGQGGLARDVVEFVRRMTPARTERERIATHLQATIRSRAPDPPMRGC
jgi:relaxase-like protein